METAQSSVPPLVILNPAANRGKMQRYRSLVQRYCDAKQWSDCYRETQRVGDASLWAAEAARDGRPLVVIGGDGTVHEAANGLLSSGQQVPLGIVAAGSGNDYAWRTLNLPHAPEQALELAFHGRIRAIDAGRVNDRYFINSFSIGLDADIAEAANHLKKYPLMSGERLYYVATLRQLLFGYQRCPWLRFSFDAPEQGLTPERRYILLAVTLGPAYGGGFRINPDADPADGLLDVCVIRYMSLFRVMQLLPLVQRGKHAGVPEVSLSRARALLLESTFPVMMEVDGETSQAQRFAVQILPAALSIRMEL
ncbi:MAG TPA: diacylglycerol kinase family protein [Ktedonobacteraceae bacterium]|nr:diacylglycerol kinase family protein [Ktedonobacteraceae bacterium]